MTNRAYWWPILGALIGYLAWSANGQLFWLIALPYLWASSPSRLSAGGVWISYYLAGSREVPEIVATFFQGQPLANLGTIIWFAHAFLLALPWLITWTRNTSTAGWVIRTFVALVISTIPPLGLIGWLSPLLAAGEFFPGMSWAGLALLLSGLVALAAWSTIGKPFQLALIAGFSFASVFAHLTYVSPQKLSDFEVFSTELGKYPYQGPFAAQLAYHQTLIDSVDEAIKANPGKVLVFPESVAGRWTPQIRTLWRATDRLAESSNTVLLVGADVPAGSDKFVDGLVVMGAESGYIPNRIPMPFGVWAPWSENSAIADVFGNGLFNIRNVKIGLFVCYEEYLVFPMLLTYYQNPKAVVGIANHWFLQNEQISGYIQNGSAISMARLFNLPVARSVNNAKESHEAISLH